MFEIAVRRRLMLWNGSLGVGQWRNHAAWVAMTTLVQVHVYDLILKW